MTYCLLLVIIVWLLRDGLSFVVGYGLFGGVCGVVCAILVLGLLRVWFGALCSCLLLFA